ncbi:2-dehydro-3-deoxy-D-gluconate 5-dehydrogenase KduD [Kinneretia aquatilis]|uniref:2-dehydro-3-deoxy-D-gluconate 5-dehydrogenase KduD n=1 Tax=Kinneretia aquatilis TaxID=2070761 RepID=UPI0014952E85|nr:2-dehydro-3-deoxy-D-gluconate 5-dehydrogenase KduD [Paucibacter aquatile]WIV99252.1 2-dehydro-3-deoxy-D-gluconate 5-dehydrogenase KduD [Paucibacter aquatile]
MSTNTPSQLQSLFSLQGRVALVTAGASGIGQALAIGLAQAGADVAITRHSQSSEDTEAAVRALGRQCLVIATDLARPEAPSEVLAQTLKHYGRIDVLVNNAGIIRRAPAAEVRDEDWDAVLDLNLDAAWRLCQGAGRQMLEQGSGRIINIASLLSLQGGIRVPAYAAAKHALLGLTRALANEWAGQGVGVNAIAPGYIETANTAPLRADPERSRQVMERIPAGRWGQAQDLVGAAVFLASPASAYMHGQLLVVDGGWMAR